MKPLSRELHPPIHLPPPTPHQVPSRLFLPASVPTARPSTSLAPVPAPCSTNPLPAAPEAYSHLRKSSVSRPSQSQPPSGDAYRAAKREQERYVSTRQPDAAACQARLLAKHEATLNHMEARQRKVQGVCLQCKGCPGAHREGSRTQCDERECRRRSLDYLRKACNESMDTKPTKGKPLSSNLTFYDIPGRSWAPRRLSTISRRKISLLSSFHATIPRARAVSAVTPSLTHFVAYALHRTRLHSSVTFCALYLLSRLKDRFPAAHGSSGHRLYISAFMIASKVICDDTYSNKSWCVVSQGMFTLCKINQMEREMCGYLEWVLNVKPEDLCNFEAMIRKEYGSALPTPAPVAIPIPRQPAELRKQPTANYVNANPYPSPVSTPPLPSHSNSTSPMSSTCQTPPSASPVK
ncbi:hypothetical protein FRC08_010774, partial [Ceratobasidium sp. 394]